MTARMVVTHRRYTKAEKDAYRARVAKRRRSMFLRDVLGVELAPWQADVMNHHFGDNKGRRVPTITPRNGVL